MPSHFGLIGGIQGDGDVRCSIKSCWRCLTMCVKRETCLVQVPPQWPTVLSQTVQSQFLWIAAWPPLLFRTWVSTCPGRGAVFCSPQRWPIRSFLI